jgi:hypothetical protein
VASESSSTRRRVVNAAGMAGLTALLVWGFAWWASPPQMGADEDVFTSVDALFTAVTARDEKLLGQCEQRLLNLQDAERLPDTAWSYLDGVISMAHANRWDSAAERLYRFMLAQRREDAPGHQMTKKKDKRSLGRGRLGRCRLTIVL